ncbi:MAG: calcium-binding protein [Rivularia sp. (in: cyanobacteria)]
MMSKGNFEEFLEALGAFESGKPSGDPQQYEAVNDFTGATGKYQFTQILMQDLDYYQNDTNLFDNVWDGEFLGKNGITSLESWKNNPAVQETGIRESFFTNYGYVNAVLDERNIPNLDTTFLSNNQDTKTVKFYKLNSDRTDFERDANGEPVLNQDPQLTQVNLSLSGIIAGAHLRGGFGVGEVISQLDQKSVVDFTDVTEFDVDYYRNFLYDEINTSIFRYINDFGDYDAQNSNFTLPSYGNAQDYILYGTLNQNSIDGGNGNDGIYGLQENDFLTGLNGNDSLYGGSGSDKLLGGDGEDVLDGWYKSFEVGQIDELTGGKGGDTFVLGNETDGVYYLGDGNAVIKDFRFLERDRLQLTGNIKDYSISFSFSDRSLELSYKNDLIAEIDFGGISNMSQNSSFNNASLNNTSLNNVSVMDLI